MKIGVDIGGSHVGVGLLNNRGTFITKKEMDLNNTAKKEDYSKILLENIIDLITKVLEEKKVDIKEIDKFLSSKKSKISIEDKYKLAITTMCLRFFLKDNENLQ